MNPVGLILVAAGAFAICGGIFDWEWFMNSRRAWLVVTIFGRGGARIFYAALGALFVLMGLAMTVGIIHGN